jgi:hypothetical protein
MEIAIVLIFYVLFPSVFGAICAVMAKNKGRNAVGWFFIGFFLGCLGLILIAVVSNLKEERARYERMRRKQRRLREQLKQERMKNEAFQGHVSKRLDRHDDELDIDTRQVASAEDIPLQLEAEFEPAPPGGMPALLEEREWRVRFGNRISKPLTFARLKQLYAMGNIDNETQVRSDDHAEWRPIGEVPGLEAALNA